MGPWEGVIRAPSGRVTVTRKAYRRSGEEFTIEPSGWARRSHTYGFSGSRAENQKDLQAGPGPQPRSPG